MTRRTLGKIIAGSGATLVALASIVSAIPINTSPSVESVGIPCKPFGGETALNSAQALTVTPNCSGGGNGLPYIPPPPDYRY